MYFPLPCISPPSRAPGIPFSPGLTPVPARFEQYRLSSHFQPVISLSMLRPVGYEALLRATDASAEPVPPAPMFAALSPAKQQELDCLSHRLHLANFRAQQRQGQWLFLNMTPGVFLQARHAAAGHSFGDVLAALNISPHDVVIEVLEESVRDSGAFESAVAFFRELGCLIALDDFGAGSSNFDRVWKIRPQIVKLDRSLIVQAAGNTRVRRILPQLVSLLHEAGAMVLVEGIESTDEAYIALDANADFAQGYLFGRPQAQLADQNAAASALRSVWQAFDQRSGQEWQHQKNALAPYINAIGNASVVLGAGRSMPEACVSFFQLPAATICYLLDQQGQQIGLNHVAENHSPLLDPRLAPLADTQDARWSRGPYFRRALENFGTVQVTRPYLSIASARMCVTVSVSLRQAGQTRVICGDVGWPLTMSN